MTRLTRRQAAVAVGGLGLTAALPALAPAQPADPFRQLQLGRGGTALLNPRVSHLDETEDALLDSLLGTGGRTDPVGTLTSIQADAQGLLADPGRDFAAADRPVYRQELEGVLGLCGHYVVKCRTGRLPVPLGLRLCKAIDWFVGRWYPCNDLYEVGVCEGSVWAELTGRGCNFQRVDAYFVHVGYELQSLVRYHPCGGGFATHSRALLQLEDRCQELARQQNLQACRGEFTRFATACDAFARRYYPQWF
jgi:hypothetical protein